MEKTRRSREPVISAAIIWAAEIALLVWVVLINWAAAIPFGDVCDAPADCAQKETSLRTGYSVAAAIAVVVVAVAIAISVRRSAAPRRTLLLLLGGALMPFGILAIVLGVATFRTELGPGRTPPSTAPPNTESTTTLPPTPRTYGQPIDLGVLPGGTVSFVGDVNDDGVIVGASFVGELKQYAVWWPDPKAGPVRLDRSLPVSADVQRQAVRINDSDHVLVRAGSRAFVVDPRADSFEEVSVPFAESFEAQDLNDSGQVVGTAVVGWPPPKPGVTGPSPITHAFLWEKTLGVAAAIDLGTLPGEESSAASAINDHGQIVGSSGSRAFVRDAGTRQMRALAGSGAALDLNDKGLVIGGAEFPDRSGGTKPHAALWNLETATLRDLGKLPGGAYDFTVAQGINDAGQIVGGGAGDTLWVWDPTTQAMTPLRPLAPGDIMGGATINGHGQIVGVSGDHAALWNPTS